MLSPLISSRRSLGRWLTPFIVTVLIGCGDQEQQGTIMTEPKSEESEELVRFHKTVENGSLEELKQALINGADVNTPGHVEQTALMVAIAAKDLEKMKLLVKNGADPELTDEFNDTALRHAVSWDFADGVAYLLSLGVDRGYHPKYPLKKVTYDLELPQVELPEELKESFSEEEWKESIEEGRNSMTEWGQNPTVEPMISDVQSVNVLKLFLEAGDDLKLAPTDVKRAYVGLSNGGEFRSSRDDYRKHKSPRCGTRNPDRMDNPFWSDMIRLGFNAYAARQQFNDNEPFKKPGAVWCYDRFGSSLTQVKDGRFVQIGGEHEDHYDPDFHIYNDIVIHDGKGNFQIHGYPKKVFPPTDFHTATLVGDWIYIVGCLGYPDQRQVGRTPIYRLKLESWEIETVKTSGEMPSWLYGHHSKYDPNRNVIRVEGGEIHVVGEGGDLEIIPNEKQFELDLSSFQWRNLK